MPDKKHNFTVTEIKAGALVLVSAALLALFVAVVSGIRPPAPVKTYVAYFRDTSGLNRGADVRFGGLRTGRVVSIEPFDGDQSLIRATFTVEEDMPVNQESAVYIGQVTLTAEKHLEVTTGNPHAALLPDGAEIPTAAAAGGLFGALDVVAASVTDVVGDVRTLLGVQDAEVKARSEGADPGIKTITDILGGVDGAIGESAELVRGVRGLVEEQQPAIAEILAKLQSIQDSAKQLVDNVDGMITENRPHVQSAIVGAQETMTDARGVIANVAAATDGLEDMAAQIESILANADGLSGDARTMVTRFRPTLEDILLDLRETVRYLKAFARTVSEQPQAIIRGQEPQGRRVP